VPHWVLMLHHRWHGNVARHIDKRVGGRWFWSGFDVGHICLLNELHIVDIIDIEDKPLRRGLDDVLVWDGCGLND
jgi:hypothetical protein